MDIIRVFVGFVVCWRLISREVIVFRGVIVLVVRRGLISLGWGRVFGRRERFYGVLKVSRGGSGGWRGVGMGG